VTVIINTYLKISAFFIIMILPHNSDFIRITTLQFSFDYI